MHYYVSLMEKEKEDEREGEGALQHAKEKEELLQEVSALSVKVRQVHLPVGLVTEPAAPSLFRRTSIRPWWAWPAG